MLLQAAACMAGTDPAKMYRLPDSEGMRNEIVIQNSHRFSYDQAYRAAGARLVGVGDGRSCTPWELESAIGDRTAAVAYLVAPFTSRRALPLDQVIEVAHAKGVPVIVDAASRLPPRENLRRFIAQGADMVIFSGGKGIRGPQGTGVLCGRADLIEAAAANGSPNRFIGRSMKVAKEEIVGLVTALRLFVDEDEDAETREYTRLCQKVVDALIEVPGIGVSVEHDDYDYHLPTAVIRMSRDWAGPTVDEIATSPAGWRPANIPQPPRRPRRDGGRSVQRHRGRDGNANKAAPGGACRGLGPRWCSIRAGARRRRVNTRGPMSLRNRIALLPALAALVAVMAAACGGASVEPGAESTATEEPTATAEAAPSPSPTAAAAPTPSPTATPEPFAYDPNLNMFLILSSIDHPPEYSLAALQRAEEEGDTSQVPVILEAALFFSRELAEFSMEIVGALTGQNFGLDLKMWREWLGPRLDDYAPPSDYARWKVNLLSLIDPAMGALMEAAIEDGSRANLTEIVWGGVAVDGIPPLEDPWHVKPELASYLEPDDRVFGVSINGEHRAYPLRVLNAHELANDELGGEPISLVY